MASVTWCGLCLSPLHSNTHNAFPVLVVIELLHLGLKAEAWSDLGILNCRPVPPGTVSTACGMLQSDLHSTGASHWCLDAPSYTDDTLAAQKYFRRY